MELEVAVYMTTLFCRLRLVALSRGTPGGMRTRQPRKTTALFSDQNKYTILDLE